MNDLIDALIETLKAEADTVKTAMDGATKTRDTDTRNILADCASGAVERMQGIIIALTGIFFPDEDGEKEE